MREDARGVDGANTLVRPMSRPSPTGPGRVPDALDGLRRQGDERSGDALNADADGDDQPATAIQDRHRVGGSAAMRQAFAGLDEQEGAGLDESERRETPTQRWDR